MILTLAEWGTEHSWWQKLNGFEVPLTWLGQKVVSYYMTVLFSMPQSSWGYNKETCGRYHTAKMNRPNSPTLKNSWLKSSDIRFNTEWIILNFSGKIHMYIKLPIWQSVIIIELLQQTLEFRGSIPEWEVGVSHLPVVTTSLPENWNSLTATLSRTSSTIARTSTISSRLI